MGPKKNLINKKFDPKTILDLKKDFGSEKSLCPKNDLGSEKRTKHVEVGPQVGKKHMNANTIFKYYIHLSAEYT